MSKIVDWCLKYPRTVTASAILITVLFGWKIPSIRMNPDIKAMIPQDFPQVVALNQLDSLFGGSEILVVAVESDSVLVPGTLAKFESMHRELEDILTVDRVLSLYSAKEVVSSTGGFEVTDILQEIPQSAEEISALKTRIKSNDLVFGNLVSEDFRSLSFLLMLSASLELDDQRLKEEITELISEYRGPENVYVAGLPFTRAAIVEGMQHDLRKFLPYGIFLMIVLLALSFRSWMGVFLPLMVVAMSIIWTFGLMALLKVEFVFINVLIPVMLIAVANDYGIHMIAHYFENFKRKVFVRREPNIRETTLSLHRPIFLAGITTIIGFLSLLGHILPPAKKVGLLAAFGILVAFVLSLTFVPAGLRLLRIPPWIAEGGQDEKLNSWLAAWGRFFVRRRRPVLAVSLVMMVLSAVKIPTLTIDTDPIHYYREGAEIRVNNERISELFGGSTQLSLVVNGDIKDPEVLKRMKDISDFLESRPFVSQSVSIVDQIEKMNEAWNEGDPIFRTIPEERAVVAAYLELFSMQAGDEEIERLVDIWGDSEHPEGFRHAQVIATINRISSAEVLNLIREVDAYVGDKYTREEVSQVTGAASLMGVLTDLIARGQIRSLVLSIVMVFLVTALVFRSIQAGIYNIIPLGGAVVVVFGLMSLLKIELNVATSMLTGILIGVGIDYTIHFLWHYRANIRRGKSAEDAVIATLTTSGKGIIFNAFSVMVGFVVLLISGFLPIYFFGFVIIFSIGICLFGALAILPALVVGLRPKFLFQGPKDDA
ncbi:MAG: MMPL family transporter [Candidatus Neomarinimicrobiota bacterium]